MSVQLITLLFSTVPALGARLRKLVSGAAGGNARAKERSNVLIKLS